MYLSASKAASLLGISRPSLVKYHTDGLLEPVRRIGVRQQRQYTLEQLRDFSLRLWGVDVTGGEKIDRLKIVFVQLGEWAGSLNLTQEQDDQFDQIIANLDMAIKEA